MKKLKISKPNLKSLSKNKIIITGVFLLLVGFIFSYNNKFDCSKFVEDASAEYRNAKTEEQYASLYDKLVSKIPECEYKESDFNTSVKYSYLLAATEFVQGNFEGSKKTAQQAEKWVKSEYDKLKNDEERAKTSEGSREYTFGIGELSGGYPTPEISGKRANLITNGSNGK